MSGLLPNMQVLILAHHTQFTEPNAAHCAEVRITPFSLDWHKLINSICDYALVSHSNSQRALGGHGGGGCQLRIAAVLNAIATLRT